MNAQIKLVFFCFLGAFLLYLITLAPSVGFVDSGELSTVCATLGIAHPTGYPLYTVLGHVFSWIPIKTIAWRTNLFSALFSALTVGVLAWMVFSLLTVRSLGLNSVIRASKDASEAGKNGRNIALFAAVIAAGYFAFSTVHWVHAVTTEVYPLTVFLAALLLGGLLLWFPQGDGGKNGSWLFLWCYLWGLGFGNHMMIVFLAPAALLAILLFAKQFRKPVLTILIGGLFFLLGVSVCLYLPIRSSLNPLLDWGDPQTLERLWNHLAAKQYRIWMFSQGFGVMAGRFMASLGQLWHWMSPPGVILAVIGFVVGWRHRPKLNWILLTLLLANLVYALNYDIPDIDPYYLPSHLVVAIWAGLGGYWIASSFVSRDRRIVVIASIILTATLVYPLLVHWGKASHRGDILARSLGKGMLDSVPTGALVLHSFWDLQSIGCYLQQVEHYRTDVALIDALLMERSWYVRQQQEQHPDVFEDSETEVSDFLQAVSDFESGRPFDPNNIETRWIAMMNGLIEKNVENRRVLVGFLETKKHPDLVKGFEIVPREFFYEVNPWEEVDHEPPLALNVNVIARPEWVRTARTRLLLDQLAAMAVKRAQYRGERGEYNTALKSLDLALRLKPGDPSIRKLKEELEKRYSGAIP